jgi:hypothetical protein
VQTQRWRFGHIPVGPAVNFADSGDFDGGFKFAA